jgi:hypothetical protein
MSYDPFRRAGPEQKPREEIFVWSFVKDVRTFTGSLRAVDDERWEALYLINGALYKTQVFATRVLAEHDLMRTKDALEATGWRPQGSPRNRRAVDGVLVDDRGLTQRTNNDRCHLRRKSTDQNGVAMTRSPSRGRTRTRARLARVGRWPMSTYVDDGISGAEFANRPGLLR